MKRFVSFVVVFVVCLLIAVPASAVEYDFTDTIEQTSVNDDTVTYQVSFPSKYCFWNLWRNNTVIYTLIDGYNIFDYDFPDSDSNIYRLQCVLLGGKSGSWNGFSLSNVPNGAVVSFDALLDIRFGLDNYTIDVWLQYFDSNGVYISDQKSTLSVGPYQHITASYVIDAPKNASSFTFSFEVKSFTPVVSDSSEKFMYFWDPQVSITVPSYYASQIEQGNISDQLDDYINGEVDPQEPADSGSVDEFISSEDKLLEDAQDGLDDFAQLPDTFTAVVLNYSGAFLFLSSVFNLLADTGVFRSLLIISLGLGVTGLIFNLAGAVGSKRKSGDE